MVALDNNENPFASTSGYNIYMNFRSNKNIGEKASSLCFYGGTYANGTVIEIYGK